MAPTAAAGASGYLAHKAIMRAGGYRAVAKAAGVDIEHVIDYAGIQSARLPGIARDLGATAGETGDRMIEVLKRALAKTAVKVWLCGSSIEKSLVRSGKEISTPPARNPLDFIPVWGF